MGYVGKPDGASSRHYGGGSGTLGAAGVWNCPGCGKQNDGRRPEQGCAHCGAGDPSLGKAGKSLLEREAESSTQEPRRPRTLQNGGPRPAESIQPRVEGVLRIYRLIEYVIRAPKDVQMVLRNSLVGQLEMAWGSITGTIVDSLDPQQEDRLRMARMQPGVWLANPGAMAIQGATTETLPYRAVLVPRREADSVQRQVEHVLTDQEIRDIDRQIDQARSRNIMEIPDTGPAFSVADASLAQRLLELHPAGYRWIHTLALALSSIAPELEANSEPEKFLSSQECLALANALMAQIPAEWFTQDQLDAEADMRTKMAELTEGEGEDHD